MIDLPVPAGANAGNFPPLSLKEIAAASPGTGGPIAGHHEYSADGAGVRFATHICDLEIDPKTSFSKIVRNIPLRNIQDVTVTASMWQRLIKIGDIEIESASEQGKIVLDDIHHPDRYANIILGFLRASPDVGRK
jgi:hypothetical protein